MNLNEHNELSLPLKSEKPDLKAPVVPRPFSRGELETQQILIDKVKQKCIGYGLGRPNRPRRRLSGSSARRQSQPAEAVDRAGLRDKVHPGDRL